MSSDSCYTQSAQWTHCWWAPGPARCAGVPGFWAAVLAAADASAVVPLDRWDVDTGYAPTTSPARMTAHVRTAAFMPGVADFDAGAFRLSAPEAGAMDPQQRLLLEVAAGALADAGPLAARDGAGAAGPGSHALLTSAHWRQDKADALCSQHASRVQPVHAS